MLLPNTPLQRTRIAPRRSPLNGRPLGVRTPDPNDADHRKVHLLWGQSRVCCSPAVFKWHSAALMQQNLKQQEPQTFIRL
jgi:hypothetical protein